MWQPAAVKGIEHPARNGDLKALWNLHNQNRVVRPSKGSYHFNFHSEKRMVPVMDFLWRELMSSVRRRCGTASPATFPAAFRFQRNRARCVFLLAMKNAERPSLKMFRRMWESS